MYDSHEPRKSDQQSQMEIIRQWVSTECILSDEEKKLCSDITHLCQPMTTDVHIFWPIGYQVETNVEQKNQIFRSFCKPFGAFAICWIFRIFCQEIFCFLSVSDSKIWSELNLEILKSRNLTHGTCNFKVCRFTFQICLKYI